ncbi:hypothetical protein GGS23DRAFT_618889 [Durotheca rogersii]|uniref:uncharacterized protein n=1 Tax=Durotheca rogersii TaxID=419775 RepID=UPI00221FEFDA|nr:uncharacterized protein GGS23DRAFT_618889 [Durotheca rogersii]KAI5855574.1 hypothetical protein GGS23DRAFT_618889 [Durotheca rogersii]
MSVPPQLIRVKRKATEEAPVSFLRVQENKRHRSEAFVYRRQEEKPNSSHSEPPQSQRPIIHTSEPHTRTKASGSQATGARDTRTNSSSTKDNAPSPDVGDLGPKAASVASSPRRFHMSRKDIVLAAAPYSSRTHGGVTKKRSAPTLFVERKIKQITSRPFKKLQSLANVIGSGTPSALPAENMDVDKPELRKLKKPGVAKLANEGGSQKYKAELPKAMTDRWKVDMDKLTDEMNAYAMEQIGLNLQKASDERHAQPSTKAQSKLRPKLPAKRYAERHPEVLATASADRDMMDTDVDISDSDDGEYIIETYERVPASKLGEHVPPQSVGVLVFDEEPDLEYFYGDAADSEDEWAEDEEDENAENYYTADYPDEEVASDDEYDRNPYSFRTGNASDLEEYDTRSDNSDDDDTAALSDQETLSGRFTTYIGRGGLRTNHL